MVRAGSTFNFRKREEKNVSLPFFLVAPSSQSAKSSSSSSFAEEDEEWAEVGKKNKAAVVLTERAAFPQSLITEIFGGELRSVVKKQGLKASASIQPFFCLHLDHPRRGAQTKKQKQKTEPQLCAVPYVRCSRFTRLKMR